MGGNAQNWGSAAQTGEDPSRISSPRGWLEFCSRLEIPMENGNFGSCSSGMGMGTEFSELEWEIPREEAWVIRSAQVLGLSTYL